MSLGLEVGHGPGDFVLDGDPAPSSKKGGGSLIFFVYVFYASSYFVISCYMQEYLFLSIRFYSYGHPTE